MIKITHDQDLVRRVIIARQPPITDHQAELMLHAIGADYKKERRYLGRKIYHAYRNYYDAGGYDIKLWNDLVAKGYAEKGGHFYHVTTDGLRLLELMTNSTIYDNYDCVADCKTEVLKFFMKADVYCGYGCWFPTSAKSVAVNLMMPLDLARKTSKKLAEEGLLVRGHEGGISDEGYPYCHHGYYLTQKARDTYSEYYSEMKKQEYEYINGMLKESTNEQDGGL